MVAWEVKALMASGGEATQRKGRAHMRHNQADQFVSMLNSMQMRNRKYILNKNGQHQDGAQNAGCF